LDYFESFFYFVFVFSEDLFEDIDFQYLVNFTFFYLSFLAGINFYDFDLDYYFNGTLVFSNSLFEFLTLFNILVFYYELTEDYESSEEHT
jgi:hypothetical protein